MSVNLSCRNPIVICGRKPESNACPAPALLEVLNGMIAAEYDRAAREGHKRTIEMDAAKTTERAITARIQATWRRSYSKTDWWKRQEERNKEEALKLQVLGLAIIVVVPAALFWLWVLGRTICGLEARI